MPKRKHDRADHHPGDSSFNLPKKAPAVPCLTFGDNTEKQQQSAGFYGSVLNALVPSRKSSLANQSKRPSYGSVFSAFTPGLKSVFWLIASAVLLLSSLTYINTPTPAYAINEQLNFQARLLNASGGVVPDGNYHVRFRIYNGGDGNLGGGDETLDWTETYTTGNLVRVVNGYLSVQLGSLTAFGTNVDWNDSTLWLSIEVGGNGGGASWDGEMDPFMRLTSVPYAFNANQLDGLDSTDLVQIAQGEQAVNSASTLISIDQAGAGDLIDLQVSNSSVFNVANNGDLTVGGVTNVQGGTLTLGTSAATGSLVLNDNDAVGAETITITTPDVSTGYTLTLPSTVGNANECLANSGTAGILTFTACGGGGSLFTETGGSPNLTYLTDTSSDFALGGNAQATSALFFDVSTSQLSLGVNESINGGITFFSSGAGETDPTIVANASGDLTLSAPTGSVVVGSGSGDIQLQLSAAADDLVATKTATISAAYSGNDFSFTRNITNTNNTDTLGGAVFTVTDTSTAVASTTVNYDLIFGNAATTGSSFTGNLLRLQVSGSDRFSVDSSGNLTSTGTGTFQGGSLTLGSTANTGSIVLNDNDGTGAQTVTLTAPDIATSYTLTLPSSEGNANECLANSGTAGILTFTNCGDGGVTTIGAIDSQTKSANGAVIDGTTLYLQSADASFPGLVTTGTQTFAGAKTFSSLITGQAGLTVTGAAINLNASSDFNTNINTGTSTGAVSIGNSSAGAITLSTGSTIGINGTTTITGQTTGNALVVNNSTSTGNIFVAQDNGSAVLTVADGGNLTSTGTGTFQGGTLTVGSASGQVGSMVLYDGQSGGNENTTTLLSGTPTTNLTFTLPSAYGTSGYCLKDTDGSGTLGFADCNAGAGGVTTLNTLTGAVTIQGTANEVSVNTASPNITLSLPDTVILGDTTNAGILQLNDSSANNYQTIIQSADLTSFAGSLTLTLPGNAGNSGQCLKTDGTGVLSFSNCNNGSGTGGAITLQDTYNASAAPATITTTDAKNLQFVLADTTTDSNFVVSTATGSTGYSIFQRADGAGTADPAQLVLVEDLEADRTIADGIVVRATNGITDGLDVSDAELTNAINIGANAIAGTNFNVTGAGAGTFASTLVVQGSSVTVGTSSQAGSLILNDGSSNTLTIDTQALGNNYTVSVPTITSNDTFCLVSLANCGGSGVSDLQGAYNGSTGGATAEIVVDTTRNGVTIRDNATPIGADLFEIQNNASANLFAVDVSQIDLNVNTVLSATSTLRFTGNTTANRPAGTDGELYFDTDTGRLLTYDAGLSKWVADRGEYIIVAANDSTQAEKDSADYVADGNTGAANDGDQIQINNALTAAAGGKVLLLAGTYVADATILIPNNTTLAGVGPGTVIELAQIDTTDQRL